MIKTYTAGFETSNQTSEANNFSNYPSAAKINTVPTNAHSGSNSYYLNGGYNGQVGLAKSISVMPGDQVKIQAYAKYGTPGATANFTSFVSSLLAAFNLTTPAPGEVGTPASGVNTFGNWEIGPAGDESKNDVMKIFATIILFDRNYNFIDVAYQAVQGDGSLNVNYTVKQPGYAYLYVSNEHPYLTDVYFDDITITHTPSPVIQQEDYYPFGLAFNSYSREKTVPQNYLYNSKEQINDLAIDWYDYGARMYMPEIGRWGVIDPMSEAARRWTPYRYAFDNPMRFIDPDGMYEYSNGYGTSNSETETGSVEHYGTFNNTENDMVTGTTKGNKVTTITPASTHTADGNAWSELDPTAAGETFETGLTQNDPTVTTRIIQNTDRTFWYVQSWELSKENNTKYQVAVFATFDKDGNLANQYSQVRMTSDRPWIGFPAQSLEIGSDTQNLINGASYFRMDPSIRPDSGLNAMYDYMEFISGFDPRSNDPTWYNPNNLFYQRQDDRNMHNAYPGNH